MSSLSQQNSDSQVTHSSGLLPELVAASAEGATSASASASARHSEVQIQPPQDYLNLSKSEEESQENKPHQSSRST